MDGTFKHPLTAVVVGPSGVGKTTFVCNLLKNSNLYFKNKFEYISIFIGTKIEENQEFLDLYKTHGKKLNVEIIEVKKLYPDDDDFKKSFPKMFLEYCKKKGRGGCIVFDDMMTELSKCGLLSDLFSKHSSHMDLSIIHITQNIFFKGKDPNEHITLYRNAHMIVLFVHPNDSSVMSVIAKRIGPYRKVMDLFEYVFKKERYIVIYSGSLNRSQDLKFSSDIFNNDPVPNMKIYMFS